jgi:putative transposase
MQEASIYRFCCSWRKEYGGLKMDQAKRLRVLEKENGKLKRHRT